MANQMGDIQELKARLKSTWMAGDFGKIAKSVEAHAEEFIARLKVIPKMRVLDVACGTGNTAIPAARAGATVTGVDIATNLLEQGRVRASREDLLIQFDEGDAEDLPYPDAYFDLVVSMYGAMFAPRPERVTSELLRVCRPGGEIAMANWTPGGFTGQLFKVSSTYVPLPPGMSPPLLWGDETTIRQRFSNGISELITNLIQVRIKYPFSIPDTVEYFRTYFGPTQKAFATLPNERQAAFRQDLEDLWGRHNRATDGTTEVESEYLEVLATRT